jgi:hypothetical protein
VDLPAIRSSLRHLCTIWKYAQGPTSLTNCAQPSICAWASSSRHAGNPSLCTDQNQIRSKPTLSTCRDGDTGSTNPSKPMHPATFQCPKRESTDISSSSSHRDRLLTCDFSRDNEAECNTAYVVCHVSCGEPNQTTPAERSSRRPPPSHRTACTRDAFERRFMTKPGDFLNSGTVHFFIVFFISILVLASILPIIILFTR